MKKFGEVDILSRLSLGLQKLVDSNKDITEKITVICQYYEGATEDTSNLMRIKFAFEYGTSEINECISTLNGINQILSASDVQKSLNKEGPLSTISIGQDSNNNLCVTANVKKDLFESTNLYKSLTGIGKFSL